MAFKIISKNNIGVVLTLILVILLSQSRFLDFLLETHLGRIVLLSFIIFISYINKFFGLLAVLFIIIAFNNSQYGTVYSYNYFEGFDVSGNSIDISGNSIDISGNSIDISGNLTKQSVDDMIKTAIASSNVATTSNIAKEGFCTTDRELNILRGKQSNSIPVYNKSREQSDEVDPTDKSIFSGNYATF
jgi:hypothetical protein